MRYKKVIAVAIIVVVASICVGMIYDINKRFPAAEVEKYTSEAPLELDHLILIPEESRVYTCEEYAKEYPNASGISGIKEEYADSVRVIVLSMTIENPTNGNITFRPEFSTFEGLKSCVNNGVIRIDDGTPVFAAGTTYNVRLMAIVRADVNINQKWLNRLDEEQFVLVYKEYPIKKMLYFD